MNFADSHSDWILGAGAAAAGAGLLTFVLFPLAIPMLLLTIVAVLPFVLPLLRGLGRSVGTRPPAEPRPVTRSVAGGSDL